MAEAGDTEVQLPLVWIDPESVEIIFVNQMLIQRQGEEYVMTFGQQTPPLLTGTPEEKAEQVKQIGFVPVRVAVRLGTTKQRIEEIATVLERFLAEEPRAEQGD